MWDACVDGCTGYLCVAPIVPTLADWNITYWAACPVRLSLVSRSCWFLQLSTHLHVQYVLDKPCRHQAAQFTCNGLWTSNFSSAIFSWIDKNDYLSFVSALGDASLTYNLTSVNPVVVYWDVRFLVGSVTLARFLTAHRRTPGTGLTRFSGSVGRWCSSR